MRPFISLSLFAFVTLAGVAAYVGPASGEATPMVMKKIPAGYRDWRFVSVAREEAPLDDIRAILGNDAAIKAYREAKLPFPDGTILTRLAYSYETSEENNNSFGRRQSFVAGHPKNGVQFMVKDSRKFIATGGWGYAQFNDGKAVDDSALATCYPCHQAVKAHDFVFTHYAP